MQEPRRTGGNRDFTLKGYTQNVTGPGTQGKSLGQTYLLVLEGLLEGWDGRGRGAAPHAGDTDTGSSHIWELLLCVEVRARALSWAPPSCSLALTPGPANSL